MNGDQKEASDWMKKAEKVAEEKSAKEKYSFKLDMIRSLSDN